ncbi:MAG: hypothetical protein AAFR83_26840, partial [Cyanobacteria bacterium J06629_18]
MTSETPSPTPISNRINSMSPTNQINFQNTPMHVFNPYVLKSNQPTPTPLFTPSFRGFTPVSNSTIPTFIPINQLPQYTVARPVTPRIPGHRRIATTTSTNTAN